MRQIIGETVGQNFCWLEIWVQSVRNIYISFWILINVEISKLEILLREQKILQKYIFFHAIHSPGKNNIFFSLESFYPCFLGKNMSSFTRTSIKILNTGWKYLLQEQNPAEICNSLLNSIIFYHFMHNNTFLMHKEDFPQHCMRPF